MDWMIYGANGYTGELIACEAKKQGQSPVLAGRSTAKIAALGRLLNLPSRGFSLDTRGAIAQALQGMRLVLNCAGPFSQTADPMMRACIAAKAHYLDITGEVDVLERAHRFDAEAKAAGVVLCPGVGFDVVPTDCIALMLKKALPDATELALGFDLTGREMSAGTSKTFVEAMGQSGKIRRNGRLVDFAVGRGLRRIDFGRGEKLAMPIRWGDVASAYYTTDIPNIMVFTPISPVSAAIARLSGAVAPFLRSSSLQKWLKDRIEKRVRGPDAATRERGRSWVWGEARNARGQRQTVRIVTLNGYSLTVYTALAIAEHVLANDCPPGCWTPAALMGEGFVLRMPGTSMLPPSQEVV
jgi:short subunit dehydrogenase-like uncharacterized protein